MEITDEETKEAVTYLKNKLKYERMYNYSSTKDNKNSYILYLSDKVMMTSKYLELFLQRKQPNSVW